MNTLAAKGQLSYSLARPRGGASSSGGWWLSGGIAASDVVAVWQPIAAASQEASATDLSGNGYDVNVGTYSGTPVYPSWTAADGWYFDNTNHEYLTTGVKPDLNSAWTFIVRYQYASVGAAYPILFGVELYSVSGYSDAALYWKPSYNSSGTSLTSEYNFGVRRQYLRYSQPSAKFEADNVMGFIGEKCYYDGSLVGSVPVGSGLTNDFEIYLGANHLARYNKSANWYSGYIKAMAIYNKKITEAQFLAVKSAMEAL